MELYIILIVAAGFALLLMQKQGVLPFGKKQKLPPVEKNIFNLDIGDLVQHDGIDWFVEGKLIYNAGSYNWFEYLLRDDNNILWLSVEEDDYIEVSLLTESDLTITLVNSKPPKTITYENINYKQTDSGTATINRLGNTLNREGESCKYFDYKGTGDRRLSVEIWGGDIEVTVGNKINPRMLDFLPGDGRKVYG